MLDGDTGGAAAEECESDGDAGSVNDSGAVLEDVVTAGMIADMSTVAEVSVLAWERECIIQRSERSNNGEEALLVGLRPGRRRAGAITEAGVLATTSTSPASGNWSCSTTVWTMRNGLWAAVIPPR